MLELTRTVHVKCSNAYSYCQFSHVTETFLRNQLRKARFPLTELTDRADGFPLPVNTGRQHGTSTRVVETGL